MAAEKQERIHECKLRYGNFDLDLRQVFPRMKLKKH